MKKKVDITTELILPNLKDETMEFAAPADGKDVLDTPEETQEITPEELDALYAGDKKDEAEALNTAATDALTDEDNFIMQPDAEDSETM